MVRWKIYVGGKQRGKDHTNRAYAIQEASTIASTFKQVYVYEVVNGKNPQQIAKWVDGNRVG